MRDLARSALLCLLLAACGPVEVVMLSVPDGGFPGPPPGPPCLGNGDCPPDAYCEKADCSATTGRCQRRPLLCDAPPAPVCGCNGVTYWSECQRRAGGVAASTAGECTAGIGCTTASDCGDSGASCAHLVSGAPSCPASVPGSCWVLPAACGGVGGLWQPCSGGPACFDLCAAVHSEQPHRRVSACQ